MKVSENSFEVGSENELKMLLYGIEQRFYTTPVGGEKRLANSVITLNQGGQALMDKLKMQTANKADENFKKLAAMFPNAVTEAITGYDANGKAIVDRAIPIMQ